MQHPIGRHHRQCQSLTGRLWALFALTLASVLAYVFIPNTPTRTAIEPAPRRAQLPPSRPREATSNTHRHWQNDPDDPDDPDEVAGALVRPYMPVLGSPPPMVPRPRVPVGDLLAASTPAPQAPDDLDDLAAVIRTYLRVRG